MLLFFPHILIFRKGVSFVIVEGLISFKSYTSPKYKWGKTGSLLLKRAIEIIVKTMITITTTNIYKCLLYVKHHTKSLTGIISINTPKNIECIPAVTMLSDRTPTET